MEDESADVSLNELYQAFKEWYHDSIPNEKVPNKSDLKDYGIKTWGSLAVSTKRAQRTMVWRGRKVRPMVEDEADFIIA